MPIPPTRPPRLVGRVFRGSWAIEQGLVTYEQLRSSAWRRLRQDVYADAELPVTHRLLISAVGLLLPRNAGFAGRSAAVLWGVADVAGPDDPVEVVVPRGTRWNPKPGVRVRRLAPGQQLVQRGRWLCTGRAETAVDLLRWRPVDDGVVLLDQFLHAGLVGLDAAREAAATLPRCQGSARAREAARLADGPAESPQETRLRLLMIRAGLPAPVAQFRVFDDNGFLARVDFAYPDLRIAIEYDGLWHGERQAFLADRGRINRLVAAGWVIVHVTVDDLSRPR